MPSPPKIHGQPMMRRDDETGSIFLEVFIEGADEAETKWYLEDQQIDSSTGDYKFGAIEHGGGQVLFQCEIVNACLQQGGTYKAIFANNEGCFKARFGRIGQVAGDGCLCRHTDTNFEACRLYTKTNFDRTDFTHDHRFCMHEH